MPVSDAQKMTVQITSKGVIASGGAGVQTCENVFNYRRNNSTLPLDKDNIATAFVTNCMSYIAPELHQAWSMPGVTVRFLEDNLDQAQYVASPLAGTQVGDRAPNYECVTVQMLTGLRGRNYRGRKLLSPLWEGDTDGDVLASTAVGRFTNAANRIGKLFSDAAGNVWTPFVYSPSLSTLAGDLWTIGGANVQSVRLNLTLGTCRSRKPTTVYVNA